MENGTDNWTRGGPLNTGQIMENGTDNWTRGGPLNTVQIMENGTDNWDSGRAIKHGTDHGERD